MPPKPTNSELADNLHAMLHAPSITYPNPVDTELQARKLLFTESAGVLFVLQSAAGRTPEVFENEVLKKLVHGTTIASVYLYPVPGWSESDPIFDFAGFSALMARYVPNMCIFHLHHMLCRNFSLDMNLTKLHTVRLVEPQIKDGTWNMALPSLKDFSMQNHSPPIGNFAQSLVQCPNVETFFAHKYWHNRQLPELYLPSCREFTFRRGDCTSKLSLYVPRVRSLNLDACYTLKRLDLLMEGHTCHGSLNLVDKGSLSKFSVSIENANIGPNVVRTLERSGRLLNPDDLLGDKHGDIGFGGGFAGMDGVFRHLHAGRGFGGVGEDSESDAEEDMEESEEEEEMEDSEEELEVSSFCEGERVRVLHLNSRPDLIGRTAVIIKADLQKTERVRVRFDHDLTLELSIKKENLGCAAPGLLPEAD